MTAKIVEWRALELPDFARRWANYTVVDPDKEGALVMHENELPVRALLLDDVGAACKQVAARHSSGPMVLVIEMPYVGKNADQAMRSGRRTGTIPGLVAGYADARVEVVWVYPATWQAHLKRAAGIKGKLERDQLKLMSAESLPHAATQTPAYLAARKEQRQAIADGCAIGRWWRDRLWGR